MDYGLISATVRHPSRINDQVIRLTPSSLGSYTQYCDLSRQYDPEPYPNTTTGKPDGIPVPAYTGEPIEAWFEPNGKGDLLAYMKKHWTGLDQPSWILWGHEFSKHATCFSTFQTECYVGWLPLFLNFTGITRLTFKQGPNMNIFDDLWDFFETTIAFYRQLPTYRWLSKAHIRPSNTTAYSLSQIQHALTRGFGELPFVGCGGPKYNETEAGRGSNDNGGTVFNEVWYYYHAVGASQRGEGVKIPVVDSFRTTCAKTKNAIWYYERTEGSEQ